jgi:large subunit ribosomal protein L9
MRVILTKDVENLGKAGDAKTVADGFGRNFLLPKGLAKLASKESLAEVEQAKAERRQKELARKEGLLSWQKKIKTLTLRATLKQKSETEVFGSVNEKMIREFLEKEGIALSRQQINLAEPLKTIGEHEVPINLGENVETTLKVVLTPGE